MPTNLRRLLLAAFALLAGGPGAAEKLPPGLSARLDEIAAAVGAMERDGETLAAAAAKLRTTIEADPSLAGPISEHLRAMLRQSGPGGAPEVRMLLLPFLFLHALPGGPRAETSARARFNLVTADGGRSTGAFVGSDTSGRVHHYD